MTEPLCPESGVLQAFVLGALSGHRWESVFSHVEACQCCQDRLEQLDGAGDELLGRLQQLRTAPLSDEKRAFWGRAVLAGTSQTGPGRAQVTADAGSSLARKLIAGPVWLDRFELRAELGVGSFGYVFQAWDPRLERLVALKVQRAGGFAVPEEVQRFLREARSAAQLKHASIVSLYETRQTEEGVWFLVCEYIDGSTLEARLRSGPLASGEAVSIAIDIADALHYAHEHGVIHRDVKPSNIIIDRRNRAHLMDFGLAKRDSGDPSVTSDGRVLGTPAYMSPEQASGTSHQVDARTDVYSLGVVLYEMLTGQRPFQGNRRSLLLQVLEDDPRPLRSLIPAIPRDLEVICLKALHKTPAQRYSSARDFAADLLRFQQGRPTLARPPGYLERTLRWCLRYPLAVGVLAAVMLGSLAGLWYLSSLSEFFVRQTALEGARLETKMLDEVWRFYSEEIADIDPNSSNVSITENYRTIHPSLPLPATFAIDLGERISRRNPGMEVRVYSRYPWPGRDKGGPRDDVEAAALDWLESHAHARDESPTEYARFVDSDDRRELHYYTARFMEQSCLGCHNHPDSRSPKKNWQVGDVVGVLKIVRPLDREIDNTQRGLRGAFTLMGAISAVLLTSSIAVTFLAQRRRKAFRE